MLYLLGLLTAVQIVMAQTLWKLALQKTSFSLSTHYLLSVKFVKLLISPYVISGVVLYIIATLCFFLMLTKFEYANTQTVVVASSLLFAFLSAVVVFNEHLKLINIVGIGVLLVGVILITKF